MNNLPISKVAFKELVQITSEQLGLQQPYVIEKDFYVTKAISLLSALKSDIFKLVFQGGTALAKAHQLVQRMSEDCDFRLILSNKHFAKNRSLLRSELKKFHYALMACLETGGFYLDDGSVSVCNEGRFIKIEARYDPIYSVSMSLKPYILLEFFLGELKQPVNNLKVTSLINQVLGVALPPGIMQLDCMSVLETAAAKWVALIRRIVTINEREYYYKQGLIRHLYDLFMIHHNMPLKKKLFTDLVLIIFKEDRQRFNKHSKVYSCSSKEAISHSLAELANNPIWRENWEDFIRTMIYGDKPSYQEVLENFNLLSFWVLDSIDF